jgi:hypothetical protein
MISGRIQATSHCYPMWGTVDAWIGQYKKILGLLTSPTITPS